MVRGALFEREAIPHLEDLRRFAFSLCRDTRDSHDLVQETMLKACLHFSSYRQGSNCRAWLFQICKNSYLNELRRRPHEPRPVDFQDETFGDSPWQRREAGYSELALLGDDPSRTTLEEGLTDRMAAALEKLPTDYRTVVILSDIEEQPYEEIAAFLDVPVGTVRSRLHRGRRLLATHFGDPMDR